LRTERVSHRRFLPAFDPGCRVVGRRVAVDGTRLDRRGRREVAGEVARIEIDAMDHTRPREAHHAEIVAGRALAARFPAVHPLAVVVVLAGNEDGRLGVQHPVLRREEIVAGLERLRTETRVGKIHVAPREIGCVGIEKRNSHDVSLFQ
jgi:hypothetical protein